MAIYWLLYWHLSEILKAQLQAIKLLIQVNAVFSKAIIAANYKPVINTEGTNTSIPPGQYGEQRDSLVFNQLEAVQQGLSKIQECSWQDNPTGKAEQANYFY